MSTVRRPEVTASRHAPMPRPDRERGLAPSRRAACAVDVDRRVVAGEQGEEAPAVLASSSKTWTSIATYGRVVGDVEQHEPGARIDGQREERWRGVGHPPILPGGRPGATGRVGPLSAALRPRVGDGPLDTGPMGLT